jgi:hypothetical protein
MRQGIGRVSATLFSYGKEASVMKWKIMELKLELPSDLIYQFPTLMDVVRYAVKSAGIPLKVLADKVGERDENALSRKLSSNDRDNVNFPLKRLDDLIAALGDEGKIIVQWLVLTHLVGPEQKAEQGAKQLQQMMPLLARILADVGGYRVEKAS